MRTRLGPIPDIRYDRRDVIDGAAMRLVVFGVSNHLGGVLDCALELGLTPSRIVMNVPEVTRERTISVHDRIRMFPGPLDIIDLEDFVPLEGECCFLGTTAPGRRALAEQIDARFGIKCCSLIHPMAYVSPRASVGAGVYIGAHSSIGPGARIGEQASISSGTHVAHDAQVGAYSRLFTGCVLGGSVRLGHGMTIGMNAVVNEELVIGEDAYIAAGAVVTRDVPPHVLAAGVPATVKKAL